MEDSTKTKSEKKISPVLYQPATFIIYKDILLKARISEPNETALALLVIRLVQGRIKNKEFVQEICSDFSVSNEVAGTIAKAIEDQVLILLGDTNKNEEKKLNEEIDEIKQNKADVLEKTGPLDIPGMVKEICGNPLFHFDDPVLQDRCAKLIESRVRDVRSSEQTRSQLEKTVEQGGLGVTGRRLSDILSMIEERVLAVQEHLHQEEQRRRLEQQAVVGNKNELVKKEEMLMTKKYVELTGKVPKEHISPTAPPVSRTSVALSAHHEQMAREGRINADKIKEVVKGAKQVGVPSRPKVAPSMQEVIFKKRLSSPIDELRLLSLTDFRRLSKDPFQAATKIKDKVDLMDEQGSDKKVEAISAWRNSALNQQYVRLTRDAVLSGLSLIDLLEKKRSVGEETLTDDELNALMKLNSELRF